ncbi:hypothetical protein G9A89_020249 [Geosiphon pyriformis]|nr:hypothetical protein G9A89_020249 [Geosiphon pyriformis]
MTFFFEQVFFAILGIWLISIWFPEFVYSVISRSLDAFFQLFLFLSLYLIRLLLSVFTVKIFGTPVYILVICFVAYQLRGFPASLIKYMGFKVFSIKSTSSQNLKETLPITESSDNSIFTPQIIKLYDDIQDESIRLFQNLFNVASRKKIESSTLSIPHPQKHYRFITEIAYSPKDPHKISSGPHNAGEDAFFTLDLKRHVVLGLADGVGGWAEVGVDSSEFSWHLMNNAKAAAEKGIEGSRLFRSLKLKHFKPEEIMQMAYRKLVEDQIVVAEAANLGDSGFQILRESTMVFGSCGQQHAFNCPYQLAINRRDNQWKSDSPREAERSRFHLFNGDVVIVASDGLWDNLFMHEIEAIVKSELNLDKSEGNFSIAKRIANKLVYQAKARGHSTDQPSPFSISLRGIGKICTGG